MTIGFIGTGNMGGALMHAFATLPEHTLIAYNRGREKLLAVCEATGAKPCDSAAETAQKSDVLVLAVKPAGMGALLEEVSPVLRPEQLIVTIAAGLPISFYTQRLGDRAKVVRTLPNVPAQVQAGMTPMCFADNVTPAEQALAQSIFAAAGRTEVIPESLMDPVCTLTGCSPAFVFLFLEAMADASVQAGIPRQQAYRMAAQAVMGSAKLMLETGQHPGALKDAVCSPGGTTIRGVSKLEESGFRGCVIQAMEASTAANRAIK